MFIGKIIEIDYCFQNYRKTRLQEDYNNRLDYSKSLPVQINLDFKCIDKLTGTFFKSPRIFPLNKLKTRKKYLDFMYNRNIFSSNEGLHYKFTLIKQKKKLLKDAYNRKEK